MSKSGAYLSACVIYAVLMKRTPEGLPNRLYDGNEIILELPAEEARQLQTIAWRAALTQTAQSLNPTAR